VPTHEKGRLWQFLGKEAGEVKNGEGGTQCFLVMGVGRKKGGWRAGTGAKA